MRTVYLTLIFTFAIISSNAQVQVTATQGPTAPSNYTTLKAAFDAVNDGTHKGDISIFIIGNTTETATAVLNESGGASSYTSLRIIPDVGNKTISGNIDGPLIEFNGADFVEMFGNTPNGILTLINVSAANTGNVSTVHFTNDASNNWIADLNILGSGTSNTSGTIRFGTAIVTGNDDNRVDFCNISDAGGNTPANAIFSQGSTVSGQENSGDSIRQNIISNFFNSAASTAGIALAEGNTAWTIAGNKFYQTVPRTFTTGNPHRIIHITSGGGHTVSGNTIGYASAAATGNYTLGGAVTTRFLAIDIAGTAGAGLTTVSGNSISNFHYTTSNNSSGASGIWCAVNIASGDAEVTGNNIGSTAGTGNIMILPTVAGTLTVPITSASTGTVTISNNTIGGIDVLPSAALSGNMTGIQAQGTSGTITIMGNTIGNNTAHNMRIGTLGTTTGNGVIRGINNQNQGSISIQNNLIQNLTHYSSNALSLFRAIEMQQGTGSIEGNTIRHITANGTSTSVLTTEGAGILVTSSGVGIQVLKNTISNLNVINVTTANGLALHGIYLGSNVNGPTISGNRIFALANASTSVSATIPGVTAGIYLRDANVANPVTVSNNMISLGSGQSTNTAIIGIWNHVNSTTGYTARIYYNTVNIEGTVAAGAQPSFGYLRGDFSPATFNGPVVDIKNNIFTNRRTGGTGKHYAIANSYNITSSATGWASNASDNNILNAAPATVGHWSGDQTFNGWQTASSSDFHSYSGVPVVYVNNAEDLHLVTTIGTNSAANGKALPLVAITTDFDNDVRDAVTPDIGADEFAEAPVSVTMEYFKGERKTSSNLLRWKAGCSSNSVTFFIERSTDGRRYNSIGSFTASRERCSLPFDFEDRAPANGTNYYRLRMTEIDGQVTYSFVIKIINKESGFEIVNLLPTVVPGGKATLNISSAKKTMLHLEITSMSGSKVGELRTLLYAGSNSVDIPLTNIAAGAYVLTAFNSEGERRTTRFIKQ